MDNKSLLLAFVLSIILLWSYTTFIAPSPSKNQLIKTHTQNKNNINNLTNNLTKPFVTQPSNEKSTFITTPEAPSLNAPLNYQAKDIIVDTPLFNITFSERGGTIRKVLLKKYFKESKQKGGAFILLDLNHTDPYSLDLSISKSDPQLGLRNFSCNQKLLTIKTGDQHKSLIFKTQSAGIIIEKVYTFQPHSYGFNLTVYLTNESQQNLEITPKLCLHEYKNKAKINTYAFTGLEAWCNHRLLEYSDSDIEKEQQIDSDKIEWVGLSIPYFIGIIAPTSKNLENSKRSIQGSNKHGLMTATIVEPTTFILPGKTKKISFFVFYGPRDLNILEPLGHNLASAVNFGWFDLIAKPMLTALNFFNHYVKNYGIAIIIITILIKILLWPIAAKSYNSMKKIQELQPILAKIKEKYKNDREHIQQETMQLYKTYKVNPLGGCLPMLIQFPVFIAFYKVIGSAIELRHAPFTLWINDLTAPDRLPIGFDFAIFFQQGYGVPVLTMLMGGSMFLQQKMTPSMGDSTQAKIMLIMPIVFIFMFLNFPSGLVLYWLVQGVLSIGQQYWTNKQKIK